MTLVKYAPVKPLNLFRELDVFNNWMDNFYPEFRSTPAVDVIEDSQGYCIKADVPGFDKKDVVISVDQNVLTIEGQKNEEKMEENKNYLRKERSFSSFRKSVQLYEDVDVEKIKASLKNGTLELNIPKKDAQKIEKRQIVVE